MACDNKNCVTLEQLYNILNNLDSTSGGIPVGARVTVGASTAAAYFDTTGLGGGIWSGWAISNGNNGTTNRLGRFTVNYNPSGTEFQVADIVGGSSTVTLTTTELPTHTHSFSTPSHTHPVTDAGHTHTVTDSTELGLFAILNNSAQVISVSNSFTTTLNKQQIRVEDSVAPTNPKDIEVYVPSVDLQAYGGLTSGSDAVALGGSGSVTVPAHTHSTTPSSLAHDHTDTVSTNTTGITVSAPTTDAFGVTESSGAGQPFTILPPYIVEVPVEKIN